MFIIFIHIIDLASTETALSIKLQKILDDEKRRRLHLEKKIVKLENKSISKQSNEDSLR